MDLLAKYFASAVYQAPDAAAAAADPPAPPAPPADPAASGDATPPALEADPSPPPRAMIPQDVFVREITPLRTRVRETETELEHARRTIREQNEMLQRLQQRPADPAAQPQPQPAPRDDRGRFTAPPQPENFEEAVRAESFKREFARDTGDVRTAGMAKFADFQQTLGVLDALGVTTNQVILDLLSADKENAHVILDHLAKNPEKAAAITSMDQGRRIAEFVRMAPLTAAAPKTETPAAPAAPAARVSRAPNPPPPIDPGASQVVDWRSDKASDEEFTAGFNETMAKRHARR